MDKHIAIVIALLGVFMILKALTGAGAGIGGRRPLAKRFMTPRELALLDILECCLPEYRFHAQVAMLKAPPRLMGKSHPADRNAFSQKIIDFVAQDRVTGATVALIEVDDASHNAQRDSRRDAMTSHAGYRTIRIGRAVQPRVHEVRVAIAPLFPGSRYSRERFVMSIAVVRGLRAFEYNWMASRLRLVPIRTVCPTTHREQREVSHGAA